MKFLLNKTLTEKKDIAQVINNKLDHKLHNCIYALNNKLFKEIIKIGSTQRPEFRKFDYHTGSPYPFYYDWVIYLENFNCYLFDDIIKYELDTNRLKENGGTEFYTNKITASNIEDILKKYDINYTLELGDKFLTKPVNYKKNYDKIELNLYKSHISNMDAKEIQLLSLLKSIPKNRLEDLGINIGETQNSVEEDCDHSYLDSIISKLDFSNIKSHIKCQSINFIYDKLRNSDKINRKSLILGDIQSGKTNEIIQLSYFICRYLGIPAIIMLQNKKAGISQLRVRIDQFNRDLKSNKIHYHLEYKIANHQTTTKKKIYELFHPQNHRGEIIICLCNPKQLNKIKNSIKLCKEYYNKVSPFICLIDEYDDLIKSRHDIEESNKNKKKKTEIPAIYLQKKSYLSIGITATLLAPMMQEDKLKKNDIFKLITSPNYVGYNSKRLQIHDISEEVIRKKGKTKTNLNSDSISSIIKNIEKSINDIKTYSITLFNISDKKDDHRQCCEDIRNEFLDWAVVQFHSNEDNKIVCELPEHNNITQENEIHIGDKIISIKKHKNKIPDYKKLLDGEDRLYDKYSIEFENMSIQEVITKLLEYTNKICIMSGRMATRGISFVNNDYSKHITDLIYLPSDASHVTRNVQDMRIFGNFNQDGIVLTLYVEESMYQENIEKYHSLQSCILDLIDNKKTIKDGLMSLPIDSDYVPTKKIDRPALVKGLSFNNNNTWGIPLHTHDISEAEKIIKETYPFPKYRNFKIIRYTEKFSIDIDIPFEHPKKKYKDIKHKFTPEYLYKYFGKNIGKIPMKINKRVLDIKDKNACLHFIKKYWKEITNIKMYTPKTSNMNRKNGINQAISNSIPYNYGDRCTHREAMIINYLHETYYHIVSVEKTKKLPDDDDIIDDKNLIVYYKKYIDEYLEKENTVQFIYPDFRNGWPLHNPFSIEDNIFRKVPNVCYFGTLGEKKIDIIVRKLDYLETQSNNNIKLSLDLGIPNNDIILLFYSKEGYHYTIKNNKLSLLEDKYKNMVLE